MRRYIFGIAAALSIMVAAGATAQAYPPDTTAPPTTAPPTTAPPTTAPATTAPATPVVTVSNPSPAPGGSIVVNVTSCPPGSTATITIGGTSTTAAVSATGTASATITAPSAPGTYNVVVTCGTVSQSLAITVVAPSTPSPGLPATGGSGFGATTSIAVGLLVAGLGILAVAQVRRRGVQFPA